MIGNAKYQCSCVRYVSEHKTPVIVGVTVALALLLFIIIIIISVVLHRRRRKKQAEQEQVPQDNDETLMDENNEDRHYNRRLPRDYIKDSNL